LLLKIRRNRRARMPVGGVLMTAAEHKLTIAPQRYEQDSSNHRKQVLYPDIELARGPEPDELGRAVQQGLSQARPT
jgi:hypothetical protein